MGESPPPTSDSCKRKIHSENDLFVNTLTTEEFNPEKLTAETILEKLTSGEWPALKPGETFTPRTTGGYYEKFRCCRYCFQLQKRIDKHYLSHKKEPGVKRILAIDDANERRKSVVGIPWLGGFYLEFEQTAQSKRYFDS